MQVLSPDQKTMASVADNHTIAITDVATNKEIRTFEGHHGMIVDLAFSPNNEYLASASTDGTARIWKPRSQLRATQFSRNQDIRILTAHESGVLRTTFSPCSKWLVTTGMDRTARMWDARQGKLIHTLERHLQPVINAVFSPDGKQLLTASRDGEVFVWSLKHHKGTSLISQKDIARQHKLTLHQDAIYGLFFSADARTLVTVSDDGTAKLWNLQDGKLLHNLEGHQAAVVHASFSPDGKFLTTTTDLNTESLWDVNTGRHMRSFPNPEGAACNPVRKRVREALVREGMVLPTLVSSGVFVLAHHSDAVTVLAFSPDGTTLATGSDDATIQLWNTEDGTHQLTLKGHGGAIAGLAFSSDGKRLISGSRLEDELRNNTSRGSWNILTSTREEICDTDFWEGSFNEGGVKSLSMAPNGATVVFNAKSHSGVWDTTTGKKLKELPNNLEHLCYSPDGHSLAIAYDGGVVKIINVQAGDKASWASWHGHKGPVVHSAFSPDGALLATASKDKTVRIWDVARGRPHQILEGHSTELIHLSFSPDGQLLATLDQSDVAKLWSVHGGSKQGVLVHDLKTQSDAHTPNQSAQLAFSPDGQTLAVAGRGSILRLWNVASGKLTHGLTGHRATITGVAYSPDGTRIATSSRDHTARLWCI